MATWYGPLIDLSEAASHIDHFVQLLVFVHRCTPVQYKLSKGGEVIRTDIQVGDDTRPFFSVTLWKKEIQSMVVSGEVVLLQNVKITRFRDLIEAKTVEWSSLLRLIHPYECLISKGVADLITNCRVGMVAKEKLRKVIEWVQRSRSIFQIVEAPGNQKMQLPRNWKVPEQEKLRQHLSLSEVLSLSQSCKAITNACIGEMFLPITWRSIGESENETMFISRRLYSVGENNVAEDLICTGCKLCGSPLDSVNGRLKSKQSSISFFCEKSADHSHVVSFIYRPFKLYVWDESEHLPLLVKNSAAEQLFGNINAERVYSSYREQSYNRNSDIKRVKKEGNENTSAISYPKVVLKDFVDNCWLEDACKSHESRSLQHNKNINFFLIWFILLKMLLLQGKNSPLKFEIAVNASIDAENGRFEMVSVSIPCFNNI
ncbi:hypothetical protein SLEP1_g2041 [Rubroshorea leprosula]|uniref:CST complex subunit CTC1 n=1 Tax=Rubroshorea leprosula TaxID=152421 RepID=A0AAV5HP32_9ROSI|nr:hypothetical protein SLEP1_g2041 [Rubroshorea leprosula]